MVVSGQVLKVLDGHTSFVSEVTLSVGGKIVSGSWDSTVRVWSAETGEVVMMFITRLKLLRVAGAQGA